MNDVLSNLYEVIENRKNHPEQGSYTCYLFEKGLDKILKKVGEECAETLIGAKNCVQTGDREEVKNEICDLIYHLLVMSAELGVDWGEINEILEQRRQKIGNLKEMKIVDKNT